MSKPKKYKWTFPTRFRAGAYGWRASRLACQRLREAVSEIKKVAKKEPVLGAEGAVRLMEKLWPALAHVDSSSGALGSAVNKALDALIPIIVKAPADDKARNEWLDRLWQAMADDGVDLSSENIYPQHQVSKCVLTTYIRLNRLASWRSVTN